MGGRFSYGNCSQGVAGFVPAWVLVNTCFPVCCHSTGKLRGPDLWATLCQKLDHFRHEQAEKYLLPLLYLSAVPAGRDFKLKRRRREKKLNFMYASGNVSHNYLACPLAPIMWFHLDSGFVNYISSDHGFKWLHSHKGGGFC